MVTVVTEQCQKEATTGHTVTTHYMHVNFFNSEWRYVFITILLGQQVYKDVDSCTGWYKTCTEGLQRYQSETETKDELFWQEERAKYIKELEAELKDLNEAGIGSGTAGIKCFLKHLYKTYPPKNPEHKLDEKKVEENAKKALLTVILHYHPDKQDKEKHGIKWFVLCEEITKLLNRHHESFKSVD